MKYKYLIGFLGTWLVIGLLITWNTVDTYKFIKNTVMIRDVKGSGGSGVILSSSKTTSTVLTNRHVCGLFHENLTEVFNEEGNSFPVINFKESELHDLCFIKVIGELGGSKINLSSSPPNVNDDIYISGHPSLLPATITTGQITGEVSGVVADKTYNMNSTSVLISPGSSGSAVYNSKGQLVGLVFAGNGKISFALLVPWVYIKVFLEEELRSLPEQVPHIKTIEEILKDILKAPTQPSPSTENKYIYV